jgi:hypothetical protein
MDQQQHNDDNINSKPRSDKAEINGRGNVADSDDCQRNTPLDSHTDEGKVSSPAGNRVIDNAGSPAIMAMKDSPDRKGVPHVYRDFSNVPDSVTVVRKKTGGVATPFPEKLHHMLDLESKEHPSAVSWLSHGRAFLVHDPHEFTDFIMPKYVSEKP